MTGGTFAVMVVGVSGGMSGRTVESGDTRSHPNVSCPLGGALYVRLPCFLFDFQSASAVCF